VDVADPLVDFSVADYVRLAEAALAEIASRGHVALVVGGTGMYLRGLLRGLVPAPTRDPRLRRRLRIMAERFGTHRLHRLLARVDPASAQRLARGDTQRVVRALEVAFAGEATWSAALRDLGTWTSGADRFPAIKIGLDMDRETLGRRLDERVDGFYRAGLVEEVRGLLAAGVPPSANAFKAIGYREVLACLERGGSLEEAREETRRSTRRLAKRQRTWFRREGGVVWLDAAGGPESLAARIEAIWRSDREGS
jgi:tRNA dimethylallyltransferase